MEPPLKKARTDLYSSKSMDHREKAVAIAAKLSQTLLGVSKASPVGYVLERQPVRSTPASFFGLPEPESINVPSERVGQIIGKGGMKIREIQEKAQVKMDIAKESSPTTPHLREIKLTGSKEGIEKCKKLLEELYAEVDIRVGGSPDRIIEIPISVVGLVVGRGGETIRRIIEETNCVIQIQRNEDWRVSRRTPPKPGHQNVYLKGNLEALDKAERAIRDLVAGAGRRPPPQNYQFGGPMPQPGMPYPPYGMPSTIPGNNYTPRQNYAQQPYNPGQMYAPQMYNQHAPGPPQPFLQAQQYAPQSQVLNPQPQQYTAQGQPPPNTQGQSYLPSQASYNPVGNVPTHVQNQASTRQMNGYGGLNPGQTLYNPAVNVPTSVQNHAPPRQMGGYSVLGSNDASGQMPYNPGQPSPSTQFAPNQPNQTRYQNAQPNQISGSMNGVLNQTPVQANVQSNLLTGEWKTQINPMNNQQNSQYTQREGQQSGQPSYINGKPPNLPGQANGQSNQFSGQSGQLTINLWEKNGTQNLNKVSASHPTG